MPFNINGTKPNYINFNGLEVQIMNYNGVTVWRQSNGLSPTFKNLYLQKNYGNNAISAGGSGQMSFISSTNRALILGAVAQQNINATITKPTALNGYTAFYVPKNVSKIVITWTDSYYRFQLNVIEETSTSGTYNKLFSNAFTNTLKIEYDVTSTNNCWYWLLFRNADNTAIDTTIEDIGLEIKYQIEESNDYEIIDYVYNTGGSGNTTFDYLMTLNQFPDETTCCQIKYMTLTNNGNVIVGCQGTSDSNYRFRFFHQSFLFVDCYGTRMYGSGQYDTNILYEREFGLDQTENRVYIKNIDGEMDSLIGYASGTNLMNSNPNLTKASFSPEYKFGLFSPDKTRIYYLKFYKNGELVNNLRPVKFNDGTYGFIDLITKEEYKDTIGKLLGSE